MSVLTKTADCQGMDTKDAPQFRESKPVYGDHRKLVELAKKRSHARFGRAYKELVNR